jgi:ATP-binding cassette subfamily F protein 3
VANKIWYIEDHQIKEYPGTYDEYEYWKKKNEEAGISQPVPEKKTENKPVEKSPKEKVDTNNDKKIKTLSQELKKVEEIIQKLESEKKLIETEMANPEVYSNFDKLNEVQKKFETLDASLREENSKWEKIILGIDELESAG